ncbi:hypothetical protein BU24DRAFT_160475 [Aaosphaeria arxii CBS 175.79]|uniref:Uncharacterized protein n=1 Tax=Aaosphaeria arxii CBS 175.79 TaxID=1450172 RepID=A0A6A5XY10_9PLEO|nr:uncharacterized protein BU24DRAFT_160475 [Aaosphaeria arxii CBS 175.79]KAF2017839.1 hypothetical protein BU24DRAFT_160475 [Aaosphaeria arxii CBS 175.79]
MRFARIALFAIFHYQIRTTHALSDAGRKEGGALAPPIEDYPIDESVYAGGLEDPEIGSEDQYGDEYTETLRARDLHDGSSTDEGDEYAAYLETRDLYEGNYFDDDDYGDHLQARDIAPGAGTSGQRSDIDPDDEEEWDFVSSSSLPEIFDEEIPKAQVSATKAQASTSKGSIARRAAETPPAVADSKKVPTKISDTGSDPDAEENWDFVSSSSLPEIFDGDIPEEIPKAQASATKGSIARRAAETPPAIANPEKPPSQASNVNSDPDAEENWDFVSSSSLPEIFDDDAPKELPKAQASATMASIARRPVETPPAEAPPTPGREK